MPKREVPAASFHLLQPQAPAPLPSARSALGRPPHELLKLANGEEEQDAFLLFQGAKTAYGSLSLFKHDQVG